MHARAKARHAKANNIRNQSDNEEMIRWVNSKLIFIYTMGLGSVLKLETWPQPRPILIIIIYINRKSDSFPFGL